LIDLNGKQYGESQSGNLAGLEELSGSPVRFFFGQVILDSFPVKKIALPSGLSKFLRVFELLGP
jgi:hypothetical protein